MILIEKSTDVEVYSSTGRGAIQGYGYNFHQDKGNQGAAGPRILRLRRVSNFSVHDLKLVDSPSFHFTMDTCSDGEVYNMVIHGRYLGGLDGIDVWGTNLWIHDVEVSNKDECVTVKSPASHILVEAVHCNWSGGCAMGSLGADTDVHDIEYRDIYTHHSNQMFMFKSRGGSGSVRNVELRRFAGHSNAYTLDLDSDWSKTKAAAGDGVAYANIHVADWRGTCVDGHRRPPVRVKCPARVPCAGLNITGFDVRGSDGAGHVVYQCENAFGSGACLRPPPHAHGGDGAPPYVADERVEVTVPALGGIGPMPNELARPFHPDAGVPIPQMPSSFFPGSRPRKALLLAASAQQRGREGSGSRAIVVTS